MNRIKNNIDPKNEKDILWFNWIESAYRFGLRPSELDRIIGNVETYLENGAEILLECINLQANMAYSEYFQKTPTQIRGIHIREVLGEERYLKHEFLLKKVLNGEKVTFERTLPHQDGSLRHLLGAYIPNQENGKVVSFLSVIVDITELRNSEIEKRNLEVQLAESAKLAVLGEMASGVAHEINNPLVIIKGKVSRLIRKFEEKAEPDETTVKDLRLIETTANRIARIVKALRTYSRDAGDDEIQKVLLSNILNDTLELCRERFAQANIEIRVKSDPSLCINCRATQISHVLTRPKVI